MDSDEKKTESEKWLHLAVDAADAAAWTWDLSKGSKNLTRTKQYDRIMGISSASIWTQEDWFRAIHPEEREEIRRQVEAISIGRRDEYNAEYRIIRPNGTVRWVHSWGKGIRGPQGNVIRITGITRDITFDKKLKQERDHFLVTLSHDLTVPLDSAKANLDMIRKYPNRTEYSAQVLERLTSDLKRIEQMVQDVLDLKRLQAGHELSLHSEKCALKDLLNEIMSDLQEVYGPSVQFSAERDFEGFWSREGISRLVRSLVGNAIKFRAPGSLVMITLTHSDDEVLLGVHNEGASIPLNVQQLLFDPAPTSRFLRDSGRKDWVMGLMIAQGIAKAHGGRIEVLSAPQQETSFIVKLPLKGRELSGSEESVDL